jgi:hypothetical protein
LAGGGCDVSPGEMPIVPLIVGDPGEAVALCEAALRSGVFAQAIRPPTTGTSLHCVGQGFEISVAIDDRLGAGEAAAVDDRRVVERVGQDDITRAGQSRDHADVGEISRATSTQAS